MKKSVVFNNQFDPKLGGQIRLESGGQFAPILVVNLDWKVVVNLTGFSSKEAKPNLAHELIAKLEIHYDVTVVTQNVDNLHERAGSSKVIHLHGELMKVRSTIDNSLIYIREDDIFLGNLCERQSQLRPHIVWFGEGLDNDLLDNSIKEAMTCAVCVVVGTSLQVYPANSLPDFVPFESKMIVIDPMINKMDFDEKRDIQFINKKAVDGMQMVYDSFRNLG